MVDKYEQECVVQIIKSLEAVEKDKYNEIQLAYDEEHLWLLTAAENLLNSVKSSKSSSKSVSVPNVKTRGRGRPRGRRANFNQRPSALETVLEEDENIEEDKENVTASLSTIFETSTNNEVDVISSNKKTAENLEDNNKGHKRLSINSKRTSLLKATNSDSNVEAQEKPKRQRLPPKVNNKRTNRTRGCHTTKPVTNPSVESLDESSGSANQNNVTLEIEEKAIDAPVVQRVTRSRKRVLENTNAFPSPPRTRKNTRNTKKPSRLSIAPIHENIKNEDCIVASPLPKKQGKRAKYTNKKADTPRRSSVICPPSPKATNDTKTPLAIEIPHNTLNQRLSMCKTSSSKKPAAPAVEAGDAVSAVSLQCEGINNINNLDKNVELSECPNVTEGKLGTPNQSSSPSVHQHLSESSLTLCSDIVVEQCSPASMATPQMQAPRLGAPVRVPHVALEDKAASDSKLKHVNEESPLSVSTALPKIDTIGFKTSDEACKSHADAIIEVIPKVTSPVISTNILKTPLQQGSMATTTLPKQTHLATAALLEPTNQLATTPLKHAHLATTTPFKQTLLETRVSPKQTHLATTTPIKENHLETKTPLKQIHLANITPLKQSHLSSTKKLTNQSSQKNCISGNGDNNNLDEVNPPTLEPALPPNVGSVHTHLAKANSSALMTSSCKNVLNDSSPRNLSCTSTDIAAEMSNACLPPVHANAVLENHNAEEMQLVKKIDTQSLKVAKEEHTSPLIQAMSVPKLEASDSSIPKEDDKIPSPSLQTKRPEIGIVYDNGCSSLLNKEDEEQLQPSGQTPSTSTTVKIDKSPHKVISPKERLNYSESKSPTSSKDVFPATMKLDININSCDTAPCDDQAPLTEPVQGLALKESDDQMASMPSKCDISRKQPSPVSMKHNSPIITNLSPPPVLETVSSPALQEMTSVPLPQTSETPLTENTSVKGLVKTAALKLSSRPGLKTVAPPAPKSNIVTSHRSFIVAKPALTGQTILRKPIEVDALKAAEATRKRELLKQAEREKNKESMKKMKAERMANIKLQQQAQEKRANVKSHEELQKEKKAEVAKKRIKENNAKVTDITVNSSSNQSSNLNSTLIGKPTKSTTEKSKEMDKQDLVKRRIKEIELKNKIEKAPLREVNRPNMEEIFNKAAAIIAPKSVPLCNVENGDLGRPKEGTESCVLGTAASVLVSAPTSFGAATNDVGPQSIEISPYKSSGDDSSSDEDERNPPRAMPSWARESNLHRDLINQRFKDPDELFRQHEKTCSLDEVFASIGTNPKRDLNRRGSTGNWLQDRVTWKEELNYKRAMGYL